MFLTRGHAGYSMLFNSSESLLKTEGIFGGCFVHRLTKIHTSPNFEHPGIIWMGEMTALTFHQWSKEVE